MIIMITHRIKYEELNEMKSFGIKIYVIQCYYDNNLHKSTGKPKKKKKKIAYETNNLKALSDHFPLRNWETRGLGGLGEGVGGEQTSQLRAILYICCEKNQVLKHI